MTTTPDPLAELRALARFTHEEVEDAADQGCSGPWIDAADLDRILSRLGEAQIHIREKEPGVSYLVIPIQETDRAD